MDDKNRREQDLEDLVAQMFGMRFSRPGASSSRDEDAIPVDATVEPAEGKRSSSRQGPSGNKGTSKPSGGGRPPRRRGGHGSHQVLDNVASWSRRALVALSVVALLVLAVSYWWFHPALNIRSTQVWNWILIICVLAFFSLSVAAVRSFKRAKLFRALRLLPAAVVAVFLVGLLMGAPFIPGNAARYASVLKTTEGVFSEDIEQVDYSEVPVIDRASAALLGNRAMGSIPEYVSQFEISPAYSQINYQGRPVRVSPLVYADLFKWFSNRDQGIPAYVLVDMVTQQAEVVKLDQPIKYSESEPLSRNIDRYVQLKYPTYMFDSKSFELDDEGSPWWVFPVQKRTIGLFGGETIARVVLVNASSGETQDYAIEDCPDWVDRAYPSDLLVRQYNWSGAYQSGWLNSWLGQQGVVHVSSTASTAGDGSADVGYNYIAQGKDIYLYAGVTSVTADNSNVGFILVNQRTGESHYYPVAGATEESAMASAEGQVQDLGYHSTYPLLLNVSGQPTYFMSLKDDAGLVKMFAMINVERYQNVAMGDSVAECQENYLAMLSGDGVLSDAEAQAAGVQQEVSGKIATIAQAVIDGNSHFYVTLEGDDAIYDFALPKQLAIVKYGVGDEIAFSHTDKKGGVVPVAKIE